jgi:tetratricopeptide (TPR) repeat protein
MPYADPESCFEAAARHLFRHVNDVNALRCNPLVRSFFTRAKKEQGPAALLPEIHARILMEAASLCEERAGAGSGTRSRRQYAIIAALCAGAPALETAARLGVSIPHYYRERHVICTRVSRALMELTPKPEVRSAGDDCLRLLFARTNALLDQGFARKAMITLQEAYSGMPEGMARSVVRSELARATVSLGLAAFTAEAPTESGELADVPSGEDFTTGWLRDYQALSKALLSKETNRGADAWRALETLAKRRIADRQFDETSIDALLECGHWYCGSGRFSEGRKMLRHAREMYGKLQHALPRHEIAISILASESAEDAVDGFDREHHWLSEALALSISSGSAQGALGAIAGLMFYYGQVGCDEDVFALAEEGLRIAKTTEGDQLLGNIGVQIAVMLLRTRYWRAVAPLMFEVEKLTRPQSLLWGLLKYAQGVYLMRTRRHTQAQASLANAYEIARNFGNRKLESVSLRELAVAKHQIGALGDSADLIRHAVDLAEELGSAYTLWITYDTAARLLPDRRIARLAQQAATTVSLRAGASQLVADRGQPAGLQLTRESRAGLSSRAPKLTIHQNP